MMDSTGTARLEKMRVNIEHALSREMIDASVEIERFLEDSFLVTARGYVWGEKAQELEIKHPRDWWQAFKERWFPAWHFGAGRSGIRSIILT